MKTELVDMSPTRKELKIEIDAADVRAEYDRVSDRYAAQANVPGFRKGRATRDVVRRHYKNQIRGEVVQNLVPQAIQDAIIERNLDVIGEPDIHLDNSEGLDKLGEQPLSIHAHVEVLPEVELGNYKGLEVARRVRPVTDETVEEVIAQLRESNASLQPVEDRGAEVGDTVTVDFLGKYIEPPEADDVNVEAVDVVLGGEGVLPEFTEQLTGMKPDDVKTFRIKYPEDFSAQGLAGKEIEYTATVTAVRRKELPELDDEWARSLGEEIESLDNLRAKLREDLAARAKFEADQRVRDELMSKLVAAHQFEMPESLVKSQARRLLESTVRNMVQHGIDPRDPEMNWEGMQGMFEAEATDDLRGSLLLERIAEAENIDVSDEEIEQEIERIAVGARQSVEQVRAALTKQGGERSIADRLRHRKALDLIADAADVKDEEWREEEPTIAAEAADETSAPTEATSEAPTAEAASESEAQASAATGGPAETTE
ncbi:MAG TPA: trigger factor [Pyrinomonadaceae bacterium]|nr:trigger factor [Pyrinomonadaceae bacterium]